MPVLHSELCAEHSAQEKERRTKDARRTPAKGRIERTLADAPCGARLKALPLSIELGGFLQSSVLTHTRQFELSSALSGADSLALVPSKIV